VAAASPALAHEGRAVAPHDLAGAWEVEPAIVIPLLLAGWLYARGVRRLWTRGVGKGIRRWEAGAFFGGWMALAVALVSPLHPLGEALFSAHMAQHVMLMAVAAPLLVMGRPLVPMLWALPGDWRRRVGGWGKAGWIAGPWRAATAPAAAWMLHSAAVWVWHLPAPYAASVEHEAVHALQHASFLGTALLFWYALALGRGARVGYGAAVAYVFTLALQQGILGALLTFAPTPWYAPYAATTTAWGMTPLEDQHLAGLVMWVPGSVPYLLAALILFARWLRESERRTARREAWAAPRPEVQG
jgi:putative membrane protein